ncbi:MAG TPA: right-handed parallel beta-helix repeat-containing protein [Steroidobacteraceae bacterium]|nr:right-handed parallel beta-helix repeat-containing protein [Steroidobacteraceae bacterium]
MIDPEQEGILHRARLRRERIAFLRRRRAIAELLRQIDFETMWADPHRRAAFDHRRRVFYQHTPQLYEPVPKTIGRRALLASLGALLAQPTLAQGHDRLGPNRSRTSARIKAVDKTGSRVDVRNFSTRGHPYRGGSDDSVPIQVAINHAASIGGATVHLGPGPISLTGSQGIERPALTWSASGIVLKGDGPGGTVITVRYNPAADVISLGSVANNLNATQGGVRDLGIGLGTGQFQSAGAAIHSLNGQKHQFDNIHTVGGFYAHFWVTGGPNQYVVRMSRCLIDASTGTQHAIVVGDATNNFPQDTIILDLESGGNRTGRNCITVFNSGGLTITNADVIDYAQNAFGIFPGPNQAVVNSFIHNLECDTCGDDGALIALGASTGRVQNVRFSLSWFSSNAGTGLNVNGVAGNPIDGVHLSNCTAGGNVRHGIWVNSNCKNIDIDNVTTAGNSAAVNDYTGKPTDTTNTYSGVIVDDGNNIGVSIVGGRSGTAGAWEGAVPTQRYGCAFGSNTDYCGLFGATASGPTGPARNATAGLLNASTGMHNQINPPIG